MSGGERIPRDEAWQAINYLQAMLSPVCERIEAAGSFRREKSDVGDIELVCIPTVSRDLFGQEFYSADVIEQSLHSWGFEFGKNGPNYKKFFYVRYQIWVDLFITTPARWGVIFTIRTGSADFTRRLVTQKNKGGLLPSYMHVKDGLLWAGENVINTPEERDLFSAIGLRWIEPKGRI